MIYVTGDLHGNPDRFSVSNQKRLGIQLAAGDYVLVCGDFGLVWCKPPSKQEKYWLDWLAAQPYTVLFVDGNHENFDLLNKLPVQAFAGGRVHVVRPNVLHLMRGEIFTLEGKTFFCLGGATSTDKEWRVIFHSWWPQETIQIPEFDNAVHNLELHHHQVDYVVSHTAPRRFVEMLPEALARVKDCPTSLALSGLEELINYQRWFFGHFHVDFQLPDSVAWWMYRRIVPLPVA